jgi:NADH dehydrogenase
VAVRNPNHALDLTVSGTVGQIVPVQCNIRNLESVKSVTKNSDYVVNCVGILYESGKQTFASTQFLGAKNIAIACQENQVQKLIHISALGADKNSDSDYAKTKANAEEAVLAIMPKSTILRPSIIIGAEDNFFNMFAKIAGISPFLPLIGYGTTLFQPVYVGDVAQAVLKALQDNQTDGKTYELGGLKTYSFKELMEKLLFEIGKKRLLIGVPWGIAKINAWFLQLLPKPLLTVDQIKLLKHDNIVGKNALTLCDLGINPTDIDIILPTYLRMYRPTGDYDFGKGYDHKSQKDA